MEPVGAQAAYSDSDNDADYGNYTDLGQYRQSHAVSDGPASVSTRPIVTPQLVYIDLSDERIQDVLGRIVDAIKEKYPEAEFVSYIGTDPLGIHLEVYTPNQEFSGLLGALEGKVSDLYIAAGVPVCLIPKQSVQSAAA